MDLVRLNVKRIEHDRTRCVLADCVREPLRQKLEVGLNRLRQLISNRDRLSLYIYTHIHTHTRTRNVQQDATLVS
jgi:hypothetical protein